MKSTKKIFLLLDKYVENQGKPKIDFDLFSQKFLKENLYKSFQTIIKEHNLKLIKEGTGFNCIKIEDNKYIIKAICYRTKSYNAINSTVAQLALFLPTKKSISLLKFLIKNGLDINHIHDYSLKWDGILGECQAPLIYQAAMESNIEVTQFLLEEKSKINEKYRIGHSKKNLAEYLIKNASNEDIKKLLINHIEREKIQTEKNILDKSLTYKKTQKKENFKI